jgi:metallo-beta-lactamase class B
MSRAMLFTTASAAALLLIAGEAFAAAAPSPPSPTSPISQAYRERGDEVEFQKVPPIRMFDNLWYVGPGYVSVYLISTSDGLILIDASEEPHVNHVIDSIGKAGFNPRDIKHILISHGHLDHFGGVAKIQEMSGARVWAVAEDWTLIEQAGSRPGRGGAPAPRVPRRDMVIKDGDVLTLGNTTLKLYNTPGHTPGVMSAEFTVFDNGRPHKAFFSGGLGGRNGVPGFEDAVRTSTRLSTRTDFEVFLANHGWNPGTDYPNGSIFERAEKLKTRRAGDPNPFVDNASWRTYIATQHVRNQRGLEDARRAAATGAPAQ